MVERPKLLVNFSELENSEKFKNNIFWRESISLEPNSYEFAEIDVEPAQILDYLYLGSEEHSANEKVLKINGITSILNVATGCENLFEDSFSYKNLSVQDNCETDIAEIFDESISFIEKTRENGGKIFVHCQAGVSRSASVCVAFLMKKYNLTVTQALEKVRQKRRIVAPNFSFMVQLERFYTHLQDNKITVL